MFFMIVVGIVFLSGYLLLALHRDDSLFLEFLSVIGSYEAQYLIAKGYGHAALRGERPERYADIMREILDGKQVLP